jgi:hypothetical protein
MFGARAPVNKMAIRVKPVGVLGHGRTQHSVQWMARIPGANAPGWATVAFECSLAQSSRFLGFFLTFGRTGDEPSLAGCSSEREDVNKDGRPDLVCHFTTQASGFQSGDTSGVLKGTTLSGNPLTGTDSVRILP